MITWLDDSQERGIRSRREEVKALKKLFLPLFACIPIIRGFKTTFRTMSTEVVVNAPRDLMQQLAVLCDGVHTMEQIIADLEIEWDSVSVKELLLALRKKRVLIDARHLSEEMWKTVENPSRFLGQITNTATAVKLATKASKRHTVNPSQEVHSARIGPIGTILSQRHSTRSFSGKAFAFQDIVNVLWNAYGLRISQENGVSHRTISSAGALYPLVVHIALFKQTGGLEPAIYSVYFGQPGSVGFRIETNDITRFARAFLVNPLILEKAHGVIVISGSFDISGEKYGNRSMLYVPLEAGGVAQNIHLSAVEHGISTVEIGGFSDVLLGEAINLQRCYHPLTTIAFGEESSSSQAEEIIPKLEIQWAMPMNSPYRPPFAIASARVSEKRSWSNGRDASPVMAYTKAISEAKEWAACGCIPKTLIQARFTDLNDAIDPRGVIQFHPAQYRMKWFPFKPFEEQSEHEWTTGCDEKTGSAVQILADLAYFPYFPKTPYHAYANSSGVAAHPDRAKAVEISTLELVERDSFMSVYLTRVDMPSVLEQTLPESIRRRIRELRKVGFRVMIKDHSLDLAPVVTVIAQSEELECTTCASCANFDAELAIDHALMEVEAFVLSRLERGRAERLKPTMVEMPVDHGNLYDQKRYFRRADFLIQSRKKIACQNIGNRATRSWQDLLERFSEKGWRHLTIPMHLSDKYGGNDGLHIIRSIVPGMIPMTFGYRQEPAGMERIYTIAREFGNGRISYGDLTKFPHPFA